MTYNAIVSPIPWLYQTLWNSQDQGGFGYEVTVYKSATCPCGATPTSPSNINCQACGGFGIIYPEAPIQVLAMASSIDQNLDLVQFGLMEDGDLVLTPMPGAIHFDNYDLAILPWQMGIPTYGQVLTRGSGTTDTADYRIITAEGIWTVDPATGVSTMYQPTTDFTYSGKTITWVGNTPAAGDIYSIRYGAQFEWVAFNPPSPRLAFGQDLGQRAVFRKRHIILPNAPYLQES